MPRLHTIRIPDVIFQKIKERAKNVALTPTMYIKLYLCEHLGLPKMYAVGITEELSSEKEQKNNKKDGMTEQEKVQEVNDILRDLGI